MELTASKACEPETRIIPKAPPGEVASAHMVSFELIANNLLNSIEDFLDKRINTVFVFCVHLLGVAVGDDHAAGHGAMA